MLYVLVGCVQVPRPSATDMCPSPLCIINGSGKPAYVAPSSETQGLTYSPHKNGSAFLAMYALSHDVDGPYWFGRDSNGGREIMFAFFRRGDG